MLNKIPRLFEVQNKADEKKVKVLLHGDIGSNWYDSISLEDVKAQLKDVSDVDEIEVHINSYGGDVFESIAIHNYLKHERSEKITTFDDGIAASGGSIIFMAGDKRVMPANTQVMIHNPWTVTYGNAKELRHTADCLEKIQTSLEECYLPHFVGTREELKVLLDQEEHLTADESLVFGFATEVLKETKSTEELEDPLDSKNSLLGKYAASAKKTPGKKEESTEPKDTSIIKNFIKSF